MRKVNWSPKLQIQSKKMSFLHLVQIVDRKCNDRTFDNFRSSENKMSKKLKTKTGSNRLFSFNRPPPKKNRSFEIVRTARFWTYNCHTS